MRNSLTLDARLSGTSAVAAALLCMKKVCADVSPNTTLPTLVGHRWRRADAVDSMATMRTRNV